MMSPEGSFAFERMGEPMLWERFQNLRQSRKLMLSFGLLAVSLLLLFVIIYVVLLGKMEDMAVKTNSAAHRQMQDNLEKRIGEFESLRVALSCQTVDDRSARISESHDLRAFVDSLASSIVDGLSEDFHIVIGVYLHYL